MLINSKWRHFYFKGFKVGLNLSKVSFDFTPFSLPIFDLTEHVESILSAQFLFFRFDFLELFVTLLALVFQVLPSFEALFVESVFLIFKNVVHFVGSNLEIVPSLEHVGSIETFADQSFDMFVFGIDFFDFGLDLLFFSSDFIKTLDGFSHFVHIFRFILQFSHDIVDEIFNLFAFGLNRELDDLNEIVDLFIDINFEHVLEVGNIDFKIFDHVVFLVAVEQF